MEFKQQLVNQQHIINQHKRTLERERILFNREVNSLSKLEELQYSLQLEENKYKLLFEQRLNSWNQDINTFQRELEEIQSEYSQLPNELKRYLIRSPVSGTLQNTNGILENSYVFANQTIGEISPDTNLVAEVYVLPNEIGLLNGLAILLRGIQLKVEQATRTRQQKLLELIMFGFWDIQLSIFIIHQLV